MTKIYLLDSNAVSECAKPFPNLNFVKKLKENKDSCLISTISWYELSFGVNRMPIGKKKEYLKKYYAAIKSSYKFIEYDIDSSEINAEINAKLESIGKTPQFPDSQIASIAIKNGLILVTRNVSDFEEIEKITNLKIENWFENNPSHKGSSRSGVGAD